MKTWINTFVAELDEQSVITRKMLERIPSDKFDWQPHPKSMTVQRLATHIAELPSWITITLTTDELDLASSPYQPQAVNNTAELLQYFEQSLAGGRQYLEKTKDAKLGELWTLRNGNDVYSTNTKEEVLRMTFSQMIHHRAQLGVFLRLLNIPIPGSYGPSADEMEL